MSNPEFLHNDKQWTDGQRPVAFSESGKNTTAMFTGGTISGNTDKLAAAYSSSASFKEFITKCRQADRKVQTSELLNVELSSQ